MTQPKPLFVLTVLALALTVCACNTAHPTRSTTSTGEEALVIHYLEIVTPNVAATCAALEQTHGITFGGPQPQLGNARTAPLAGGGQVGVRAPMRPDENPVVRPYRLVDDIAAALQTAQAQGAEVALPPMAVPGGGKYAIYIQGGIQHGLWQL